tara:strand:- start:1423 stop:1854 length:432 start_codon:yes stop_codon:yes gene_type:complete
MSISFALLNIAIVLDTQPVLFLFNRRLLYIGLVFSSTIITQELTKDSSNSFKLVLSPMCKSSFEQLFLMDLLSHVLLPSSKHGARLGTVISQKVISNLSVCLSGSFPVMLLESCFLLQFHEMVSVHFLCHISNIASMAMLLTF